VAYKSRTSSTRERTLLIATLAASILALLLAAYTYLGPRLSTFVTFNQEDEFEFSNELNNDVSTEDTSVPPPDEDHLPANLPDENGETPAPDDDTLPFEEGGEAFQGDCIVGDYRPGGQSIRVEANLTTCFQELGGFAWCRMPGISNPFASENKYNQGNNPVNCFNTVDKDGSTSTCEGCTDGGILGMCFDIKGAFPGQDTAVTEANDCASKGGTFCQPGDNSPECLWDYSTKEGGYQCRRPGTCGEEDAQSNDDEEAAENNGRVSEFVFNCVQGSIGADGLPTKTADDCLAECAEDPQCGEQLDAASDSGVFDPGEIPGVPDEVPDEAFIFPVQDCLDAGGSFSDCTSQELDRNQESINRAIQDCVDAGGNFRDCAREELVSRCVDYGGNFRDCFSEYGTGGQPGSADEISDDGLLPEQEPGTFGSGTIPGSFGGSLLAELCEQNPSLCDDLGVEPESFANTEEELLNAMQVAMDQLTGRASSQTPFQSAFSDAFKDVLCERSPALCEPQNAFSSLDRWLNGFCSSTPQLCREPGTSTVTTPTGEPSDEEPTGTEITRSEFECVSVNDETQTTPLISKGDALKCGLGFQICVTDFYDDNSIQVTCYDNKRSALITLENRGFLDMDWYDPNNPYFDVLDQITYDEGDTFIPDFPEGFSFLPAEEQAEIKREIFRRVREESALQRAKEEEEQRKNDADYLAATDPALFSNLYEGAWGYLGDLPEYSGDRWYRSGACLDLNGDPIYTVKNSNQAQFCFNQDQSVQGPDGNYYSNPEQLAAEIERIRRERQRRGSI
jgi:hypothetical protein